MIGNGEKKCLGKKNYASESEFLLIYKVKMPSSCWTKFENSDHSACCRLCVGVKMKWVFPTIPVPVLYSLYSDATD